MAAISESLREDLRQPEFSEGYAESFQDAYVATQIKVLREQNKWTQADLAKELGTAQTVISRIENVNYSAWNISTLKKLARAFRVRLKVSFETYGSLIHDVDVFSRENLQRTPREADSELMTTETKALSTGLSNLASGQINADLVRSAMENAVNQIMTCTVLNSSGLTLQCLANASASKPHVVKSKSSSRCRVIVMPKRSEHKQIRQYARRTKTATTA